jgi:integrase
MAVIPVKGRENVFDVVVYTKPTEDAPRRRITRRVEGKTKAKQLERKLLTDRDQGKPIEKPLTLGDYATAYLDSRRHGVSAKTLQTYRDVLKWYIAPSIGSRSLTAVNSMTVRNLYADLTDRGLSAGTVTGVHRVLSMILRAAFEDDLIRRNPCKSKSVRPRKPQSIGENVERGLEPAVCKRLLSDLEGTAVYAPSALAALTGLRRGEVLALKWEDVDVDCGELHVNAALEQTRSAVTRQQPKTKRSRRTVPLTPAAVVLLRRHKAAQDALRLRWGAFWSDEGYVFPSARVTQSENGGRLWTPDAFSNAFRKALTRASERRLAEHVQAAGDVDDFEPWSVGFHEFRHTAATTWLRGGTRLEVVSRWLGHADSAITARVYSHVTAEEHREGVEAVDSLL